MQTCRPTVRAAPMRAVTSAVTTCDTSTGRALRCVAKYISGLTSMKIAVIDEAD